MVDEFEDIPTVLAKLNERVRDKRVFISGAFSSYAEKMEEYSHNFSRYATSALLGFDYRIVNGIGRRFGTHLIGYANEYLAKEGVKDIERHLIVRPFVGREEDSAQKKRLERQRIIGQCGAAIFLFGEHGGNKKAQKSGVMEEFEIARDQHKTIIPIAYPGMVSEIIWRQVKQNLTQYPYLEGKIDLLVSDYPLDKLSKLLVQILDSVLLSKQ